MSLCLMEAFPLPGLLLNLSLQLYSTVLVLDVGGKVCQIAGLNEQCDSELSPLKRLSGWFVFLRSERKSWKESTIRNS